MVKAAVVNVVATANLRQEVDLDALGELREITHDPIIYGGRAAYFKSPSMKGKVSIFSSGKMISVGTTSEERAHYELEYVKDFLVRSGFIKPVVLQPKVQNIVVVADLGKDIDLEELSKTYKTIYEPEQFPGLILKVEEPYRATALIFASGKVVIVGLESSGQIKGTIQNVIDSIILENKLGK